jgi:hypothetical protein
MLMGQKSYRMSGDTLLAIIGGISGIVGAVGNLDWITRSVLALIGLGLITYAALRHHSHFVWRVSGAALAMFFIVWSTWRPIWEDLHKNYPAIAFQWPITFVLPSLQSASPPSGNSPDSEKTPDLPPGTDLPGPPQSKLGKALYLCPYSLFPNKSNPDEVKAQLRQDAEVLGKAVGISIVITDLPYGIREDITALDASGQDLMGFVQRITLEMSGTSQGVLVTFSETLPGTLAIFSMFPIDTNSDLAKAVASEVSTLSKIPISKCRLL